MIPAYHGEYSRRPASGTCWVCRHPDTVPEQDRDRVPALCGPVCRDTWIAECAIDSTATHVVTGDHWEPISIAPGAHGPSIEVHATPCACHHDDCGITVHPPPPGLATPGQWLAGLRAKRARALRNHARRQET